MCAACGDEDNEFDMDNAPESVKQEFFDYITKQMRLVIEKAENQGVLFDLITKWPNDKQVAYEMACVIENRVLNDDNDDN